PKSGIERAGRRAGELAASLFSFWRSGDNSGPVDLVERLKALGEPRQLRQEVLQEVLKIAHRIEELDEQKEAAVAGQDFQKAASLRDESDKLKKQVLAIIGDAEADDGAKVYELLIPVKHADGMPVPSEVFGFIENKLRERFGDFTRSEGKVFGTV